ncbi:hypothetical protein [Pedobacter punctiformis]|uniref:Uncharacterized protein n=1 Tax=Pedobacter punctiformis TaxID=3004097 RepID=A0ABT4LDP6_9SPHI|nr:hypothetical protein [Pedobacter sp. HCMS5-2]MCZ4244964.1 hypothetical protein [Pedobacter sp. HCMS5-2]
MENLKYAQDYIRANSSVMSGFNMFINGHAPITFGDGFNDAYERIQGYEYAEKMARENAIAFTHVFGCKKSGCYPFQYGGFFVCNSCGGKGVDKDWWKIKVEKDGNEYCCHGLDFKNLQESDNYAFGKTFDEAIYNYGELMKLKG